MSALILSLLTAVTSLGSAVAPADIYALGQSLSRTLCSVDVATKVQSFRPSLYDPEATEQIETVSCSAGESQILYSPLATDPNGIVLYVYVHGTTAEVPGFLQVGASLESAILALGQPSQRQPGSIVFLLGESGSTLEILHKNGKIVSLAWSFYSG
ncbi:hypothetical protein [Marilutibacter alkalisoli]|uniref:Uncharacterized protein n=1 Tax=Marilutibacter alkalisoli TaxID=2591633 RepID=A0A514BQQ3_9GAMM|nr:hypothetical protein [Lysobacter alkalisoli]QDH69697.1 hypothetical protein FKV23_06000 [Lysobacter alkalisoli]